jgi:predicted alpha/beta hydrolase family esterase
MTDRRRWPDHADEGFHRRQPIVLNVPGLANSGRKHWQSRWEARYPWFRRVDLGQWDRPDRQLWVQRLDAAIRRADSPPVLVAHSLGCLAVAWWAAQHAPADAEQSPMHPAIAGFAPVPLLPLPFPSIVVASRNDPYVALDRAAMMARHWGSHLVDVGEAGHVNTDSGLGDWPLGITLLDRLIDSGQLRTEADAQLASAMRFHSADRPQTAVHPW